MCLNNRLSIQPAFARESATPKADKVMIFWILRCCFIAAMIAAWVSAINLGGAIGFAKGESDARCALRVTITEVIGVADDWIAARISWREVGEPWIMERLGCGEILVGLRTRAVT